MTMQSKFKVGDRVVAKSIYYPSKFRGLEGVVKRVLGVNSYKVVFGVTDNPEGFMSFDDELDLVQDDRVLVEEIYELDAGDRVLTNLSRKSKKDPQLATILSVDIADMRVRLRFDDYSGYMSDTDLHNRSFSDNPIYKVLDEKDDKPVSMFTKTETKTTIKTVIDGYLNFSRVSVRPCKVDKTVSSVVEIVVGAAWFNRNAASFTKIELSELLTELQAVHDAME